MNKLRSFLVSSLASLRLRAIGLAVSSVPSLPSDMLGMPELNKTSDMFSTDDGNDGIDGK